MQGERMERRGQRRMQADGAAWTVRRGLLQRVHLVAADRRADHYHRGCIETPARNQVADRAVDAGAGTVDVGAEPDAARRRAAVHSAALLSDPAAAPTS